jgi:hypothetical protein
MASFDAGGDTSSGTGGDANMGSSSGSGVGGVDREVGEPIGGGAPTQSGDQCRAEAAVPIETGHPLASATYAASALQAGLRPDPAVLRRADFQAFFAPSAGQTPGAFGRFSASDGAAPGAVLEIGSVTASPATPSPVNLVLVIDEHSSMREELSLAAELLDAMSTDPVRGLGAAAGDTLTVLEWRDEVVAMTSVEDAASALRARAKQQLAGAPSFAALGPAVQSAVAKAEAPSHVVLLTDGAFEIDERVRAELASWRTFAATSVVELHAVTAGPLPYRGPLLEAFEGGGQLYVGTVGGETPAFASSLFGARFGELFRVRQESKGYVVGTGFSIAEALPSDGAATFGPWTGDGGAVFMRPDVEFCGGPVPASVAVSAAVGAEPEASFTALPFGTVFTAPAATLSEARAARMELVDRLVDHLGGTCPPDAQALTALLAELDVQLGGQALTGTDLDEHLAAVSEIRGWVDNLKTVCK